MLIKLRSILNEYKSTETKKKGIKFWQPGKVILQFYRLVLSNQLLRYRKSVRPVNREKRVGQMQRHKARERAVRIWKRHVGSKMVASEKQLFRLKAAVFSYLFSYTDLIYSRSIPYAVRVIESQLLVDQRLEIFN